MGNHSDYFRWKEPRSSFDMAGVEIPECLKGTPLYRSASAFPPANANYTLEDLKDILDYIEISDESPQ